MPDPNLDRLQAVSKELHMVMSGKNNTFWMFSPSMRGTFERKTIEAIAADLLRLADEREEQRNKFHNLFTHMKSNATVSGQLYAKVTVALIDNVLEQLSPASPEKPDDEK